MGMPTDRGREFWRAVLLAGGATSVPRWASDPQPGVADHVAAIDADLLVTARRLAGRLGVPLGSLVVTAHAKALAALSGEADAVTGYVAAPGQEPLPCRLSTRGRTWLALIQDAARAEAEILQHRDVPVAALRRELGVSGPRFETVIDPIGCPDTGLELADDVVLGVQFADNGGALRLRYRTDALDAGAAARIAGYHVAALRLMVADPDAEPAPQSVVSAEELRWQLEGMAGPLRELPDRRAHEVFERRVRRHPDAVAVVYRDRYLTYGELNARANQLGRALLARGLPREGVVAVVTERNLDWLTAVSNKTGMFADWSSESIACPSDEKTSVTTTLGLVARACWAADWAPVVVDWVSNTLTL